MGALTEEVTRLVVGALNQRVPTKHLEEVGWLVGSEYARGRNEGALEISQT